MITRSNHSLLHALSFCVRFWFEGLNPNADTGHAWEAQQVFLEEKLGGRGGSGWWDTLAWQAETWCSEHAAGAGGLGRNPGYKDKRTRDNKEAGEQTYRLRDDLPGVPSGHANKHSY